MADTDFIYGHNEPQQDGSCFATIECPHCGVFHGYCSDLAVKLATSKEDTVLPAGDSEGTSTGRRRKSGGIEYLTNEMLTKSPTEGKIQAVKYDEENKFGARVVLKLAILGKTLYWGVTIKKNPNYKILVSEFGRDENDWVGKKIALHLEQDDFSEQYFSRVTFPKDDAKKKGRND